GTLVLHAGRVDRGTALTERLAKRHGRPLLVLDATRATPAEIGDWIDACAIRRLNVAGPRESRSPGLQAAVEALLRTALAPRASDGARRRARSARPSRGATAAGRGNRGRPGPRPRAACPAARDRRAPPRAGAASRRDGGGRGWSWAGDARS